MTNSGNAETALVSVIVPTFNRREWIGECLDSILEQTYPRIEIIVVDDQSTDDTVDWLRTHPKYRDVVLHVQEKNGGASIARNTGIAIAKGDLVVFIDSDDLLLPDHVEKAVRAFEVHSDLGLFCCDSTMIDAAGEIMLNGKTWHQALADAKGFDVRTGFRPLEGLIRYSDCFPGFTLRREVFDRLGGFDQEIFPADDYDLALRVAASEYRVFYLHEPLCLRREHDGQLSGIRNSVKTCAKLSEAIERAVERSPDLLTKRDLIRKRRAELRFEKGLSQLKEGARHDGAKSVADALARDPTQIGRVARLAGRKLKGLVSGPSES